MLNKKKSQFETFESQTFSWLKNTFKLLKLRSDFNKSFQKTFWLHKDENADDSELLYYAVETHRLIEQLEQTKLPVKLWMSRKSKNIYTRDYDEPQDFKSAEMLLNLKDSCYTSAEFAIRHGVKHINANQLDEKEDFIEYANSIIKKFCKIPKNYETTFSEILAV